jgi:thiol-disulfide isomerase/thioredoxin
VVTQADKSAEKKGALRDDQTRLIFEEGFSFSGYERNTLYLNLGNGKYRDISGISGIDSISDGRAASFADFDNDGDLDVFLTTIQGSSHLLFRNNLGAENHYLRVDLEGTLSGKDAFGATVRIRTSAGVLTKIKSGGSGFLAQNDPRLLFGLGRDTQVRSIEVTWPSGRVEHFSGSEADSSLLLREGSAARGVSSPHPLIVPPAKLPDPISRIETMARGLKITPGEPIPTIPIKTLNGEATTLLEQLKPGRRTLVNLWATWCLPCAHEMIELQSLESGLRAKGIDILGLNLDTEPNADIAGFLTQQKIAYPIFLGGPEAIATIYATDELFVPLTLLVDPTGIVLDLMPGWSKETQRKYSSLATEPRPSRP